MATSDLVSIKEEPQNPQADLQADDDGSTPSSNGNGHTKTKRQIIRDDEESVMKVRRILETEFELEIATRKNELEDIESKLEEANTYLEQLSQCTGFDPLWRPSDARPPKPRRPSQPKKSFSVVTPEGEKKVSIRPEAIDKKLYHQRPDGKFVQIVCPSCEREEFINKLGFLNHMRILHKTKFKTMDEAGIYCGRQVSESVVPQEDESRKKKKMEVSNHRRVPGTLPDNRTTPRSESISIEAVEDVQETPTITRFHVLKRIIVGNTSKSLKRKAGVPLKHGEDTHKWLLYVQGPPEEPNINVFIKSVRFFLDPSYGEGAIVDCFEFPFQIARRGWGEFQVRIQLHFHTRDAPQNIWHTLVLDKKFTGLEQEGARTTVDLPLDRFFFEERGLLRYDEPVPPAAKVMAPTTVPTSKVETKGRGKAPHKPVEQVTPAVSQSTWTQQNVGHLSVLVPHFPLVCNARTLNPMYPTRYLPASNDAEWRSWPPSRKKAIEKMRAVALNEYVEKLHGVTLGSRHILVWCRGNGHAPLDGAEPPLRVIPLVTNKAAVQESAPTMYCKYCGSPHFPLPQFARLEAACGMLTHERIAAKNAQKNGTFIYNEDMDVDIECIDDDTHTPPGLYKVKIENVDDAAQTAEEFYEKNEGLVHWVRQAAQTAPKDPALPDCLPDLDQQDGRTVHSMLCQAVTSFANHLLSESVEVYKAQKEKEPPLESRWKQFVPMHIGSVVKTDKTFTFLDAPKFPWSS